MRRNSVKFCLKETYLGPATCPRSSTAANTRIVRFRFLWARPLICCDPLNNGKVPFALASMRLKHKRSGAVYGISLFRIKYWRWSTAKQRAIGDPDKIWATDHGGRPTEVRIRAEVTRGSIRKEFHRRRESGRKSVCGCGRETPATCATMSGL